MSNSHLLRASQVPSPRGALHELPLSAQEIFVHSAHRSEDKVKGVLRRRCVKAPRHRWREGKVISKCAFFSSFLSGVVKCESLRVEFCMRPVKVALILWWAVSRSKIASQNYTTSFSLLGLCIIVFFKNKISLKGDFLKRDKMLLKWFLSWCKHLHPCWPLGIWSLLQFSYCPGYMFLQRPG